MFVRTYGYVPKFMQKLKSTVAKCWVSIGSIAGDIVQDDNNSYLIKFYPGLREVVGGNQDGSIVYLGFHFNIKDFVSIFDKTPNFYLESTNKKVPEHLMFEGKIDGENVRIAILMKPPGNEKPC